MNNLPITKPEADGGVALPQPCSARIARLEDLVCLAATCLTMLESYLGPQWFEIVAVMDLDAPDLLAAESSAILERRRVPPEMCYLAQAHAILSDFARTAPGRLPSAVQDALAPWRQNAQVCQPEGETKS